jgi:hypothetical protein
MWIPEVGRTNFYDANPALETSGQPGIFVVNVSSGELLSTYRFPNSVASPNSSFLNDIVLDEVNGFAYFTDTWGNGAIIVYSISSNASRAFSSTATQRNASYDFCVNGICYGKNGVGASPSDGIALSADGLTLYWSCVQGTGLFQVATSLLQDFSTTDSEFQAGLVFLGFKNGCSDGIQFLNGNLFYGDLTHSLLGELIGIGGFSSTSPITGQGALSAASPYELNWIDTFALDLTDSNVFYFSTNRLNLFFSSSLDFTGNSGPNFRILKATITTDVASSTILPPGEIAAIVIGCLAFVGAICTFFLWIRCDAAKPATATPMSSHADSDSEAGPSEAGRTKSRINSQELPSI